jgi:hypothetical protein
MSFYSNLAVGLTISCAFITPSHAKIKALSEGDFFGEIRYRYEFVDQDGINKHANAHTVRTNLGFKTAEVYGFTGLVEGQLVRNIGEDNFNSLANNNTVSPIVADPDVAQINRAWVGYNGLSNTQFKLGRQAINVDGQRFIGTVEWRQNDQTFDAVTVANTSIENANIQYGYIHNVNRIFGDDAPAEDLRSKSHIINASYKFSDQFKATTYGYWLDFDNAATLSSKTYGIVLSGKAPISENWKLGYNAEFARQSDNAGNVADYSENYYHAGINVGGKEYNFKAGYEVLGGNGINSFQTPLATLHKFNGWADKFLSTPANGLKDAYVGASYKFENNAKIATAYHDFSGDSSGDFGSEINVAVSKSFAFPENPIPLKQFNVLLKYADYDGEDAPFTDTQKIWFQVGTKF